MVSKFAFKRLNLCRYTTASPTLFRACFCLANGPLAWWGLEQVDP
jgi:hypothetical protein